LRKNLERVSEKEAEEFLKLTPASKSGGIFGGMHKNRIGKYTMKQKAYDIYSIPLITRT